MKEYKLKINGNHYTVGIQSRDAAKANVVVNGIAYAVEIGGEGNVTAAKPVMSAAVSVSKPAAAPAPQPVVAPKPAAAPAAAGEAEVKSPLPGVILDLKVKEGDTVAVGQTLAILEAMKMENNVDSDRAGVVKAVKVNVGDTVMEGTVIITLG